MAHCSQHTYYNPNCSHCRQKRDSEEYEDSSPISSVVDTSWSTPSYDSPSSSDTSSSGSGFDSNTNSGGDFGGGGFGGSW